VLLKSIKLLLLTGTLSMLLPMNLAAAEKKANAVSDVKDWKSALQAYDRGDYVSAQKYFEKYLEENGQDPNVLYNLGCIAEANGEQEMALWYLECAALADPLDSAAFENRNVMRRKFFLPEAGNANTPSGMLTALRDRLHPEDYLVLAAAVWMIFCIIVSLRRHLQDSWRWALAGICGGFVLVLVLAALSLYTDLYNGKRALVVVKNAELYSFPGEHNGRKSGTLPGGTPVEVIEEQSDYSLIRGRDEEGWVPNKSIRKLQE
jgi:tetratricopeptide (TPR) repeat protein